MDTWDPGGFVSHWLGLWPLKVLAPSDMEMRSAQCILSLRDHTPAAHQDALGSCFLLLNISSCLLHFYTSVISCICSDELASIYLIYSNVECTISIVENYPGSMKMPSSFWRKATQITVCREESSHQSINVKIFKHCAAFFFICFPWRRLNLLN